MPADGGDAGPEAEEGAEADGQFAQGQDDAEGDGDVLEGTDEGVDGTGGGRLFQLGLEGGRVVGVVELGIGQLLEPGEGEGEADEGPEGEKGPAGGGRGEGRADPLASGRAVLIGRHRASLSPCSVRRQPRVPGTPWSEPRQHTEGTSRTATAAVSGEEADTTIDRAMLTAPSSPWPEAEVEVEDRPLATAELSLGGMHCGACAARIEGALAQQQGVVSASVNLATTRAFVAYDPAAVGIEELCGAVDGAGYSAAMVDDDGGGGVRERSEHWGLRAAISWPLALAALVVSLVAPEGGSAVDGWTVLILAVVVEFAGGWPFLKTTARLARRGATSMDTLIALGTLAALAVERGGGHRPARGALPPGWRRRVRRPLARGDGPADRGHPGQRAGHRGPGPAAGGAGHAFAARAAAPDGAGGERTGGRERATGGPREHPRRGPHPGAGRGDGAARRRGGERMVGRRRVDAHRGAAAGGTRSGQRR